MIAIVQLLTSEINRHSAQFLHQKFVIYFLHQKGGIIMANPIKIQESKDRYLKEKVDRFQITVPKGEKATIQDFAKSQGKSLNAYVVELIKADMQEHQQSKEECLV